MVPTTFLATTQYFVYMILPNFEITLDLCRLANHQNWYLLSARHSTERWATTSRGESRLLSSPFCSPFLLALSLWLWLIIMILLLASCPPHHYITKSGHVGISPQTHTEVFEKVHRNNPNEIFCLSLICEFTVHFWGASRAFCSTCLATSHDLGTASFEYEGLSIIGALRNSDGNGSFCRRSNQPIHPYRAWWSCLSRTFRWGPFAANALVFWSWAKCIVKGYSVALQNIRKRQQELRKESFAFIAWRCTGVYTYACAAYIYNTHVISLRCWWSSYLPPIRQ